MIETETVPDSKSHLRQSKKIEDTSIPELIDVVKAYAIQETIDPLRGVGRWIGFGVGGALCLGFGLVMVLIGILRLLQEEWHRSSSGSLSWLSYLIALLIAVALLVVTLLRINKTSLHKEPK